jgi:hypothetical protein
MVREGLKDGVLQGLGRGWITPGSLVGVAVNGSSTDDKAIATALHSSIEQYMQQPLEH